MLIGAAELIFLLFHLESQKSMWQPTIYSNYKASRWKWVKDQMLLGAAQDIDLEMDKGPNAPRYCTRHRVGNG